MGDVVRRPHTAYQPARNEQNQTRRLGSRWMRHVFQQIQAAALWASPRGPRMNTCGVTLVVGTNQHWFSRQTDPSPEETPSESPNATGLPLDPLL